MSNIIISPPERLIDTEHWMNSKFRNMLFRDRIFTINFNHYIKIINQLCVLDFIKWYFCFCGTIFNNTNKVFLFECDDVSSVDNFYYNIEVSLESFLILLKHQFQSWDNIVEFIKTLVKLLDKKLDNDKKNCMFIFGPPNSGKNFFFDAVCSFLLNYGCMSNPRRNNAFPFETCHKRRVIKWDEARCDPDSYECVLNIMQGTPVMINIKYSKHCHLQKTPLIITGNYEAFPQEERFTSRIVRYNWNACESLKMYKLKRPNPLAFGVLVDYILGYNVCKHAKTEELIKRIF